MLVPPLPRCCGRSPYQGQVPLQLAHSADKGAQPIRHALDILNEAARTRASGRAKAGSRAFRLPTSRHRFPVAFFKRRAPHRTPFKTLYVPHPPGKPPCHPVSSTSLYSATYPDPIPWLPCSPCPVTPLFPSCWCFSY